MLSAIEALAFVRTNGVVLLAAHGPVPTLTEAIAGERIRGSWWAHTDAKAIFRIVQAVTDSDEFVVCRAVEGRVTLVHRRLWPALARAASRFPAKHLARVLEEHTASGRHRTIETPLSAWLPGEARRQAEELTLQAALGELGPWAQAPEARRITRPKAGRNAK